MMVDALARNGRAVSDLGLAALGKVGLVPRKGAMRRGIKLAGKISAWLEQRKRWVISVSAIFLGVTSMVVYGKLPSGDRERLRFMSSFVSTGVIALGFVGLIVSGIISFLSRSRGK